MLRNSTYHYIMIYCGYFWMPVNHSLTKTELKTESKFIKLNQLNNANYNDIENEIEKQSENY